ncbi:origin recognition complex subunit 1 NDAI_0D03050 [Naumovozyma dairenensis CBS 421]|uniref:Origin recognition complex subunit 1 n=1 Tax=Naumovozyma dairenensis (strain ATCC 10597 / BCRC 20456 / CBS 421 / NBRC 0211 / NRRL Y-12639) TaxID=1071378 RepID=G0WA08_NAUDC|nr:hypothetical protein NDAI_0D03050 [Naumovozyma dairenensis CBS 421]CCD24619.1 hypothetical protein NDAI_0D03050 [Naumovozyma dairenensis CBS 421]
MAESWDDLKGWEIIITDENGNILDENQRRRRRRGKEEKVYLERKSDNLRIGRGDSVVMNNKKTDTWAVYMIHEIRLNTLNNLVEIWSFNYLRWFELDAIQFFKAFDKDQLKGTPTIEDLNRIIAENVNKSELYLTLELSEILLVDFISMANIMSQEDWDKSENNPKKDFVVRYISYPSTEKFREINFCEEKEIMLRFKPKVAMDYIKSRARPILGRFENGDPTGEKRRKRFSPEERIKTFTAINDGYKESDSDASNSDSDAGSGSDVNNSSTDEMNETEDESGSFSNSDIEIENEDELVSDHDDEDVDFGLPRMKSMSKKPVPGRKRGRPPKEGGTRKYPHRLTVQGLTIPKTSEGTPVIRKFTKRNVNRAKKKYTPFSKRFRSIAAIPDLRKVSSFKESSDKSDLAHHNLEDKLKTSNGHKVVETIFSKVKRQLYSSHGKEEIVKSKNFDEYLPARENKFASIYLSIYSALESESATTLYVAGTPGVGKTLTIKEVIKDLISSANQHELPKFKFVEINGLKMVKATDSYEVLWNKISGERLTWAASMESLEFYFNKVPQNKKFATVVLLDELDALVNKSQDIMYNFFNWTTYTNAKLIVIAVANTMDLPERQLGSKVSSRIGFTRIMFTGYTHEELKNIIDFRLKGLNGSYFYVDSQTGSAIQLESTEETDPLPAGMKKIRLQMSPDAIEIASRKVASVSGDARRALKICKRAAEIAETNYMVKHGYSYDATINSDETAKEGKSEDTDQEEVQTIHIRHIMQALNESLNSHTVDYISHLPFTSKLFLYALLNLTKKNGLYEQNLGDVIDEIKLLLDINGTNKFIVGINETLYGNSQKDAIEQLRIVSWDFTINHLVEADVLIKVNMKNERSSCIKLNISSDEIRRAIDQDIYIKDL